MKSGITSQKRNPRRAVWELLAAPASFWARNAELTGQGKLCQEDRGPESRRHGGNGREPGPRPMKTLLYNLSVDKTLLGMVWWGRIRRLMFKNKLRLEECGVKTFALTEDLIYEGRDQTITVPAGFVTDFASVPQFMYWLIPSYGQYTNAAVVHDYLCVELKRFYNDPTILSDGEFWNGPPANPVDTDGIFRRIMREEGVPLVRRWLMWTGVRWGAMFSPYRRKGSLGTLAKVLLLSILELPFLLVPTIFILITLGIDKVVESL